MNILSIYEQYKIPENLQLHMLRVAAVGKIICDHISSQKIDADLIIKTLLLHDMGNIIKYKFNNTSMFSPEDSVKVESYKSTQAEFMRKYGNDADKATLQIIKEVTRNKQILELCKNCHGEMAHKYVNGEFWNESICYYADMRIGLNGILSVDQRFEDLKIRYPQELEKLEHYHKACKIIERKIQKMCAMNLESINDELIEDQFNQLKELDI
jgi:hypothetical protein